MPGGGDLHVDDLRRSPHDDVRDRHVEGGCTGWDVAALPGDREQHGQRMGRRGPDGTAGSYFTSPGTAFTTPPTGRHVYYLATFASDVARLASPTLSGFNLSLGGTTIRVVSYTYGPNGNVVRTTTVDATTSTTIRPQSRQRTVGYGGARRSAPRRHTPATERRFARKPDA